MGGWGSGRGQQRKDTTSDLRSLDVRRLQRDGLLTTGHVFGLHWTRNGEEAASIQLRTEVDRVVLSYSHKGGGSEGMPKDYPVCLDWTACTLGGRRAWFLCPARDCGRRVALLYIGSAGIFACRHCYRLAYASQRETPDDRATRRANTIRRRLCWDTGIANLKGGKPKGMHWSTFKRLNAEHDAFAEISSAGVAQKLEVLNHRLRALQYSLDALR